MTLTSPGLVKRGLKLSHLRLVALLAETGQISRAAEVMAITQPAASRLLAELEGILGARLTQRQARGVALTALGVLFAARARAALGEMLEAERDLQTLATGGGGRVAVGSVTGPSVEIVVPAISRLRATHPGITLAVQVDTSRALMRALAAGELDLVIGRMPEEMEARDFGMHPVGPERAVFLARAGHPLAREGRLPLARLTEYDWVLQPPGSPLRRTVEALCLAEGVALPAHVLETASQLVTLVLVARSDAVAPIAEPVAAFLSRDAAAAGIVPLRLAASLSVPDCALIWRRSAVANPAVGVVRDALLQAAKMPLSPG